MGIRGFVSEGMKATRPQAHGKITILPFKLPNDLPFSIYVRPKAATEETDVLISCMLYQDEDSSDCPFGFKYWTEPAVYQIADSATLLTDFDIYFGAIDHIPTA